MTNNPVDAVDKKETEDLNENGEFIISRYEETYINDDEENPCEDCQRKRRALDEMQKRAVKVKPSTVTPNY